MQLLVPIGRCRIDPFAPRHFKRLNICGVHLQRRLSFRAFARSDNSRDKDTEDALLKDLQRFQDRAQQVVTKRESPTSSSSNVKDTLDKVLVADFFFILVALAWLGFGVAAESTGATSAPLNVWLQLWPVLFQPALGILMLGALISGVTGWLQQRQ